MLPYVDLQYTDFLRADLFFTKYGHPNTDLPKYGPPQMRTSSPSPNTDLPKYGSPQIRTSPNADVPIYGLLTCGPIFYEIRTSKSPNTDFPKCGLPPNADLPKYGPF